ncbi:MAG: phosphotransferase, partial [Bacteroidota bacterium]
MADGPPWDAVAAEYGFAIRSRRPIRHAWRLETDRGLYALKRAPPPSEAEILRGMEDHLVARGFTRLAHLVRTKSGAPECAAADGRRYVLRPWLPGARPCLDADHPRDLARAAKAVAEMHLAAAGWLDARLPPAPAFSEAYLAEMCGFAEADGRSGRFAALYRRMLPEALREGETACRLAREADYAGALEELAAGGGFCHGDLAAENMLVHGPEAYLLDFDRARCDVYPADLGMLLRRILPAAGWHPAPAAA